ncbi:MAG: crossover junction endodeoxyribonuclease RuvC [Gammaproteobacteria bacterium]|nr:crossover junction endodeoxyribonuclease RuvC [Gammaproteobacteria bacterium]
MDIIIGIDPGSRVTGYGLVRCYPDRLEHLGHGCIRVDHLGQSARLLEIHRKLLRVVEQYAPAEAAVEEVFMGRNAAAALKLGQARGSAMIACLAQGLTVAEYSTRKIKQAVAGTGAAGKEQVQHMVRVLLGIGESVAEDAADALAVAICHAHSRGGLAKIAQAASVAAYSRGRFKR